MARVVFVVVSVLMLSIVTAEIVSNFYAEDSCTTAKGYCLLENECPEPVEKEFKDLCPNQKEEGAICCKNFPQEKVNCFQTHNNCQESCPKQLNSGRKGCPTGQTCCILV